ncbi:MAG: hypothetical protein J6W96_00135, partial [Alphaproteobacteria bacterium]|nr:hypothetical protein [Alphaproteobacteria bacterium]
MRRIDRVGKTLTKAIAVALSFSIMFGQTIGSYAEELNTAAEVTTLIEEAKTDLTTAEEIEDGIVDIEGITGAGADEVNNELANFEANEETIVAESGSAISNANIANTTDDKDAAYQAKDDAIANLTVAGSNLEVSVAAYEQANAEYVSANNLQVAAENAFAAAEAAITDVS